MPAAQREEEAAGQRAGMLDAENGLGERALRCCPALVVHDFMPSWAFRPCCLIYNDPERRQASALQDAGCAARAFWSAVAEGEARRHCFGFQAAPTISSEISVPR